MRTEPSFSNQPQDLSEKHDASYGDSQHLAEYRQRYGLSADPFVDDPHFPFYSGGQRRQVLDQLLHLCQFSNNLLLVAADYGVGKTRMAQALIDSLDDADDICFLEGQVTSSFESLLGDLLTQFDLPDVDSLKDFIQKDSGRDGLVVVIVDDAHHLTDEVLLDLIELQVPDARLHLVLLAEPHLLNRIENFDVPDAVLSDFYLEKLSLAEAVDYLNFRMEMADYLGPEIFSESNVEPWWRHAQGNLLILHEHAQEKLLAAVPTARSTQYIKKGLPLPHIVAASALGAVLLMGYFYWGSSSSKSQKQTDISVPVALSDQSAAALSAASSSEISSDTSTPAGLVGQLPAQEAGVTASAAVTQQTPAVIASRASESQVVKQSVVPLAQTNAIHSDEPAIKTAKLSSSSAPKEKKSDKASNVAKVSQKTESVTNEKTKSAPAGTVLSEQERTLLSWGEEEYTLQLVGVSSEKAAREFVAEQPNKKDLLIFKGVRQGKDWFVVVTGRFPTSAKARQAIQALPEAQKKASPWPREMKVIHKEIRNLPNK